MAKTDADDLALTPQEATERLEAYLQTMPGLKEIEKMVKDGYTLRDMANYYGISREALYLMARRHPVIYQTIADSEEALLDAIECSLREKCFPQKIREVTTVLDPDGGVVRVTRKVRDQPQDLAAMQFYLTNRRPKSWRMRREEDVSTTSDKPVVIVDTITARHREEVRLKQLAESTEKSEEVSDTEVVEGTDDKEN